MLKTFSQSVLYERPLVQHSKHLTSTKELNFPQTIFKCFQCDECDELFCLFPLGFLILGAMKDCKKENALLGNLFGIGIVLCLGLEIFSILVI